MNERRFPTVIEKVLYDPIRYSAGPAALIIGIIAVVSLSSTPVLRKEKLAIVRAFPTEKQMNEYDYVLDKGHFILFNDRIYFCAQFQHRIFVLDKAGNLIRTIGRRGQGPAEFNFPHSICEYHGDLYVTDTRNARIQILSPEGEARKIIKLPDSLGGLWVSGDKLILYKPVSRLAERTNAGYPLIGIYDLEGRLKKNIFMSFSSAYGDIMKDNYISVRLIGNRLHCLQKYGTMYRVFDLDGNVISEFNLRYDPLRDKEHLKTKYFYTFKTFCTDGKYIYAPVDYLGKICICVFNMDGLLLKRLESLQRDDKEVYDVMDMAIETENDKKNLYIFLMAPDDIFYMADVSDGAIFLSSRTEGRMHATKSQRRSQ